MDDDSDYACSCLSSGGGLAAKATGVMEQIIERDRISAKNFFMTNPPSCDSDPLKTTLLLNKKIIPNSNVQCQQENGQYDENIL